MIEPSEHVASHSARVVPGGAIQLASDSADQAGRKAARSIAAICGISAGAAGRMWYDLALLSIGGFGSQVWIVVKLKIRRPIA